MYSCDAFRVSNIVYAGSVKILPSFLFLTSSEFLILYRLWKGNGYDFQDKCRVVSLQKHIF